MLFDLGLISMDWAFFVIDLQSNGAEAASLKGFCFRVEGLRFFFFLGGGRCMLEPARSILLYTSR